MVNGGSLIAPSWDGNAGGGIIAFRANGVMTVNGTIDGSGRGYRGGNPYTGNGNPGTGGEGILAPQITMPASISNMTGCTTAN